jgi:hypothetical protein
MDLASHPNAWRARSQANKRDRTLLALNGGRSRAFGGREANVVAYTCFT